MRHVYSTCGSESSSAHHLICKSFYFFNCRGYLGPGGLEQDGRYFNCTGGAAGYIDRVIFGSSHIYQNPTSKVVYASECVFGV